MGRGHEWSNSSSTTTTKTTHHSVGMYACQRWRLKFSEDSYIGHKNKTSRPIGSYKRSKSAATLPSTDTNSPSGARGGDQDGAAGFPDKKSLQPSWNSDWTLQSQHDELSPTPMTSSANSTKEDLTRLSRHNSHQTSADPHPSQDVNTHEVPPIRPARPSASSRQADLSSLSSPVTNSSHPSHHPSSSQYKPPTSSSSSYHVPPDSSTTAGTPVFTARPFVIPQEKRISQDSSPRRAPPPVPNSSPFDPSRDSPQTRTQPSPSQKINHNHPHHQTSSSASPSSLMSPSSVTSSSTSSSSPHRPGPSPETSYSQHNNVHPNPSHNIPSSSHTSNSSSGNNTDPLLGVLRISDDQPPTLPPPREHHRRESEPLKPNSYSTLAPSSDSEFSLARPRSESSGLNTKSNNNNNNDKMGDNSQSSHSRQPSQEELECDLKARQLAEELGDKEVKLSEVLSLDTNKKRMRYMDGIFSEVATSLNGDSRSTVPRQDVENVPLSLSSRTSTGGSTKESSSSPKQVEEKSDVGNRTSLPRTSLPKEYWVSAPKAQIEMTLRRSQEAGNDLVRDIKDGHSLVQQKEELLKKLRKKLEVLEEDKVQLVQEIEENNTLGRQVDSMLASKFVANPSVVHKYKAYVEDQDKIVRLLLNLSGQLARAENAVDAIPYNSDSKLKKLTIDKRERLHSKHEEAKVLKADIDKRKDQVSSLIQEGLGDQDWQRYTQFINKKPQLTIELQELEDKIKLGMEQIDELKKSIPETS